MVFGDNIEKVIPFCFLFHGENIKVRFIVYSYEQIKFKVSVVYYAV